MRLPLLLGLVMIIIGVLIDTYIIRTIPPQKRFRRWYALSALATNVLAIVIVAWPKRDAEADLIPVMWLLYTWITIYISKLAYCIFALLSNLPRLWHTRPWRLVRNFGIILSVALFLIFWYGAVWGRRAIEVQEVEISSPQIPPAFDGYRIVQFSDAHVGTWGDDTTFIHKLVTEINALHPDAIVFTGDIVNRKTAEIEAFISTLSRLKAPDGVYSVMGNHDYGDYTNWPDEAAHSRNTARLREIQRRGMHWHLLEDDHVWLRSGNDSIALMGVENWGEPPFPSYGDYEKASLGIAPEVFSILLSHNPMHWHSVVKNSDKADLTLSGHTHAMQMRIRTPWKNFSLSALKYPEWEGLHEFIRPDGTKSQLYVNIGCGEVGFPARIGAAPELTLIILKSQRVER